MQTDFVAHVSHQLKTPLSLLSAATETLQMDRIRSPERLAQYLDTIRAEAQRLTVLVQRVLEFSRVQEQRTYEFERVDLGALVRETIDAFAHGLAGRQVVFDVRSSGRRPVRARRSRGPRAGDRQPARQRHQVLERRTAGDRHRRASSGSGRSSRSSTAASASPPREQQRIFERFYRVPGTGHRQGFGLGLPIVRELVHAQGGSVGVTQRARAPAARSG